ncbi:MurR/RpiR family transcriptional regulator [Streptococcus minor]|uniref:MurR/RpiR family transcriptional regulator n=1 Tax=Streptococcus minor TaxID=229549 RepID=A0A3P1VG88_9STRE|nr:MurR/RpiR family transcriptional regulator [Streptococcus minor]RRD32717.1 MurR/RpiR family transcriptional regulator [Streptococcus minor]
MKTKQIILPIIESSIDSMTQLEKEIAHYFLYEDPADLTTKAVTQVLHVSKASLTRFAQKCGFKGYREFAFEYQRYREQRERQFSTIHQGLTKKVLSDYDEILTKTYSLVDEAQILRISQRLEKAKRVYFYGKGLSSLVSQEMKIRFMRLGLICEAVTDGHMLQWMDNVIDSECLVIGQSISGKTLAVVEGLRKAKQKGAYTILMSTQKLEKDDIADEVLLVASAKNLSYGNRISPQFPLLLMVDLLYAHFMANNQNEKERRFNRTIINK